MPDFTARELFTRYQKAMLDWDADALADLYAADGVHEFPLFNPMFPPRLAGREEIRSRYRAAWARAPMRIVEMREIAVHETADPRTIVGEAEYTAQAGGKRFDLAFLVVMRVDGGEIAHLRDYMDALGATVELGRLPALADALARRRD